MRFKVIENVVIDTTDGTNVVGFHDGQLAQIHCARLNGADHAMRFATNLTEHLSQVLNDEGHPRDLLEDIERILANHLSNLIGMPRTIDQANLYYPAKWINE